jgi:hypothetical protein
MIRSSSRGKDMLCRTTHEKARLFDVRDVVRRSSEPVARKRGQAGVSAGCGRGIEGDEALRESCLVRSRKEHDDV